MHNVRASGVWLVDALSMAIACYPRSLCFDAFNVTG